MDGRNPRDRTRLTIDLLETLLERCAVCPDSILVTRIQSWFSARERELAAEIVTELARTPDAPVEFVTSSRVSVWLTDIEATQAYLADLRENPSWFDP
jgi:hypothetical protein